MDFQFFSEKAAVVIDIGSKYTRCGFAGESAPRRVIPTKFALNNGKKLSLLSFLGVASQSKSEWLEAVENLVHDIYFLHLQCNAKERRVIVCENLLSPSIVRESIAHILLEKYQALAVTFVYNPVVALVPLVRNTAIVIDLGFSETRVVPIYSGVGLTAAMTTSQKSTRSILASLRQQLQPTTTIPSATPATPLPIILDDNILEDIIARVCFMAPEGNGKAISDVKYPVDTNYTVNIPGNIRGNIASSLLIRDAIGDADDDSKERDIPSLILDALKMCPTTTRKDLARHILLIGGGCHIPGFGQALSGSLNKIVNDSKSNPNHEFHELQGLAGQFVILSHKNISFPSNLAWLGGAIVGTLDQYAHKITKEMYTRESKIIPDWMNLKPATVN